ncbi:hydrolase [Aliikangiella marina]|uniref:Hydrolase n=1 Tax=Aliikangiella marina TaxID=1712262 RepID=A0A545TBN1_9GAMM|nr:hydrolase [Aliikangiella marina]TQV74632.1 hydrolase [Aliikangiella marina]
MLTESQFKPAWWAKNRHVQTIWGALFRLVPKKPSMRRIRLDLADGDFIDVDFYAIANAPTVLLLHGLEGSVDSHYMRGIVNSLIGQGKQVAVMHFRGCSGESNRLLRSYHSGVSDDLQNVLLLLENESITVDYLVGFSLGGNVLLKWLGENHPNNQVKAAVAVSVPLLLDECATAIDEGFSRLYSGRLLKTLKIKALYKKMEYQDAIALSPEEIKRLNNFWAFDDQITAPLHGFGSAEEYYQKASSQPFLKSIKIPTLVIHAKDDPFMNTNVIPREEHLSDKVDFELAEYGGHVGFVGGNWPWRAEYYLEKRIPQFLAQFE